MTTLLLKRKYILEAIKSLEAIEDAVPEVTPIINKLARISNKVTAVNVSTPTQLAIPFSYVDSN